MGAANLGFKILYGPPVVEPPILFIGYQPGGEKESMIESEHQGWPEACEYVEVLEACVGVNAIFLRAPADGTYQN